MVEQASRKESAVDTITAMTVAASRMPMAAGSRVKAVSTITWPGGMLVAEVPAQHELIAGQARDVGDLPLGLGARVDGMGMHCNHHSTWRLVFRKTLAP